MKLKLIEDDRIAKEKEERIKLSNVFINLFIDGNTIMSITTNRRKTIEKKISKK